MNLEKQLTQTLTEYFNSQKYDLLFEDSAGGGAFKFFGKVGLTIAAYYVLKYIIKKVMMDKDTVKSWSVNLSAQIAKNLDALNRKNIDRQLDPRTPRAVKGYGIVDTPTYLSPNPSESQFHVRK